MVSCIMYPARILEFEDEWMAKQKSAIYVSQESGSALHGTIML
jgi:hypothetical protein